MTTYEHAETMDFIPSDLRSDACAVGAAELVELSLLLPNWQIDALEQFARGHGITTGQMMRRVIGDFFTGLQTWPDATAPV